MRGAMNPQYPVLFLLRPCCRPVIWPNGFEQSTESARQSKRAPVCSLLFTGAPARSGKAAMYFGARQIEMSARLRQRLDGERDALAAADAQRDDAALEAVAPHRVNEARGEHRAGGADGMAVRDRAALDVDDVLGQPELAGDRDDDRREGLVDLDALDLAER